MELPALNKFAPEDLLRLYGSILEELKSRGIAKNNNNPVSGYSEWLVSTRLGLKLAGNSEKGFNASSIKEGLKYEIKARRVTPANKSRELSAIRNLNGKHFDFLIAVIYDENFDVILGLKIPHPVVVAEADFVESTNSYKLVANDSLKDLAGVLDITLLLK